MIANCCRATDATVARPNIPRAHRGFSGLIRWLIPGATLLLMPKCPACLAAYVALGTGLGLSMATASCLRLSIISLCIASLAYFAATHARRLITRIVTTNGAAQ